MKLIFEKLFIVSIYLTVASLPFIRGANNIAIAILIISWFGALGWNWKYVKEFTRNIPSFISVILLFWFLIGITYSEDIRRGLKYVESLAPLLIFTVSFTILSNKKYKFKILNLFVYSVFVACIINLSIAVIRTYKSGFYFYDQIFYVVYNNFFYHRLSSATGMHAGFLTLFIGFALLILIQNIDKNLNRTALLKYSLIIFFGINIVLLKSIMVSFGILVCLLILFLRWTYIKYKLSIQFTFITLSLLIISVVLISLSVDVLKKKSTYEISGLPPDHQWNSINLRLALWRSGFEIIENYPLTGVGTGDIDSELLKTYLDSQFKFAAITNYHPHNQFIFTWISTGVLGVILSILVLLAYGRSAIRSKNMLYFCLVILITILSITDIPLSRNKTLVFFMLFASYFEYSRRV